MFATIINCVAIIAGSVAGILFSRKVTAELSSVISSAAGVVTLVIGMQMAFKIQNIIYLALSLILGGVLGSWWDIDGKILSLGRFLERRFGHGNPETGHNSKFAYAFLNSSVLFCVGAMAIIGSFKAGTEGDYTILYTKSVLDGFLAVVFSASMGIGTAFSALSILFYQGSLTLLSGIIKPFVSDRMIGELTGIGGTLVIMIGINLLELKKLKTANYLPALLIIVLFVLIDPALAALAAHFV
jgi:uncharacterized protein